MVTSQEISGSLLENRGVNLLYLSFETSRLLWTYATKFNLNPDTSPIELLG